MQEAVLPFFPDEIMEDSFDLALLVFLHMLSALELTDLIDESVIEEKVLSDVSCMFCELEVLLNDRSAMLAVVMYGLLMVAEDSRILLVVMNVDVVFAELDGAVDEE